MSEISLLLFTMAAVCLQNESAVHYLTSFAKKALKHTKFSKWFKPKGTHPNTRQEQPAFHSVYRKHDRFEKSTISYLTELLNKQFSK